MIINAAGRKCTPTQIAKEIFYTFGQQALGMSLEEMDLIVLNASELTPREEKMIWKSMAALDAKMRRELLTK